MYGGRTSGSSGNGGSGVPGMFECDGFRGLELLLAIGEVLTEPHRESTVECYNEKKTMILGHHYLQYMNFHLYSLFAIFLMPLCNLFCSIIRA